MSLVIISTGAQTLLCDFHREQAWARWLKNKDHGVAHLIGTDSDVLPMLRKIAYALKPIDYAKEVLSLKRTDIWKTNPRLARWFSTTWLKNNRVFKILFNYTFRHTCIT